MSRPLVIERVTLVGFGPYRDETAFNFPPGLGVLAAPNEAGKSTLAAAMSAILFGLPAVQDPAAFGLGRFRSWDGPPRCLGEMILDAGGVRYRIARDFDTHRIRLSRWTDGGWLDEAVGEHNPAGRKQNPRYVQWLASLFQHTSRELFHHTFSVIQPLPQPEKLSAELQSLLAGAGARGSHTEALKRLAERAKELTRRTGQRGLTPRDGQKDGRLEEIERQIAELQQAVAASQKAVEELRAMQEESAQLSADLEQLKARLATTRNSLAAFEQWRRHREAVRESAAEVNRLKRGRESCREREKQVARAEERLAGFPELAAAPAEFGEGLERLEDLLAHLAEAERLFEEARELRRRAEGLKEELEALKLPGLEGETALSWTRRALDDLEEAALAWREFLNLRGSLERIREERRGRFAVFDELSPAGLDLVESYEARRAELLAEAERAEEELARARSARSEAEEARRRLMERFAGSAPFVPFREALQAFRKVVGEIEAKEARRAEMRRRLAPVQWAALAVAAAGAVLVLSGFGREGPERWGPLSLLGAIATILPILLTRFVPPFRSWRAQVKRLEDELAALRKERERAARELPAGCPQGAAELDRLLDEMERYVESARMLDTVYAVAPADEELRRLEEEASKSRKALQALEEAVAGPKEAFDDFQKALEAFRRLAEEEERLSQELKRTLASWGLDGVEPGQVERVSLAGVTGLKGVWARAQAALELLRAGPPGPGFGELVDEVEQLLDQRRSLLERAKTHDRIAEEITRLTAEWERLAGGGRGAAWQQLQQALQECERLEASFGGDWSRLRECIQQAADRGDQGGEPAAQEALRTLPGPFAASLAAAGGDVAAARRRHREYLQWKDEAEAARQALEATLDALGCRDGDELGEKIEIAEANLKRAMEAMEALAREHPGLPAPRAEGDYRDADERFQALKEEEARLEREIERASRRQEELVYRQAQLQGETPVNIAEAELRLERLQAEKRRIEEELEALTVAYQELQEAASEYFDRHLDRLAQRAGEYFARISRSPGRRVLIDDELRVAAVEPDGQVVIPARLSQGAKDQLYLALRLAVGDLLHSETRAPFIFDDPFLNCDEQRREEIRSALAELARERQVILLTHDQELAAWGEPVAVRRGAGGVAG